MNRLKMVVLEETTVYHDGAGVVVSKENYITELDLPDFLVQYNEREEPFLQKHNLQGHSTVLNVVNLGEVSDDQLRAVLNAPYLAVDTVFVDTTLQKVVDDYYAGADLTDGSVEDDEDSSTQTGTNHSWEALSSLAD